MDDVDDVVERKAAAAAASQQARKRTRLLPMVVIVAVCVERSIHWNALYSPNCACVRCWPKFPFAHSSLGSGDLQFMSEQDLFSCLPPSLDVDFPSFRSRRAPLCNNISGEKVRKKNHFPLPISPTFAHVLLLKIYLQTGGGEWNQSVHCSSVCTVRSTLFISVCFFYFPPDSSLCLCTFSVICQWIMKSELRIGRVIRK